MFRKLLILFTLIPIIELGLFWALGDKLGLFNTFIIIIITATIGAALTKTQGSRAIRRLNQATTKGKLPTQEALDGLIIIIAGTVLITPGFLTDTIGFLLLIPTIRTHVTSYLSQKLKTKIHAKHNPPSPPSPTKQKSQLDDGNIIDI